MSVRRLLLVSALGSLASVAGLAEERSTTIQSSRHSTETVPGDEAISRTEIERSRISSQAPGEAGDSIDRTTVTRREVVPSRFLNEAVGIKPQVGMVVMESGLGSTETRGMAGLMVDVNVLRRTEVSEAGRPYLGPSLGVLYSHMGFASSDFFGTNAADGSDGENNLLIFPLNVKVGYTFSDVARLALHTGVNFLYNNETAALSPNDTEFQGRFNLGADVEFGIGKSVSLTLRPDWTFASEATVFTGTLGIGFPIT